MYRLDPCIPIFGGLFLIKNAKMMCICKYAIFSIETFYKHFFRFGKRYKQINILSSPKTYCLNSSPTGGKITYYLSKELKYSKKNVLLTSNSFNQFSLFISTFQCIRD